jgi:O-antigen/teichoic acid export membrane protein
LLVATIVSASLAWLWIPRLGLTGAALALLATVAVQAAGSLAVLARAIRRLPAEAPANNALYTEGLVAP